MGSIITLITDFGTTDAYVGAMKGVILGINPDATIVDISHDIEPQNISQASYVLSTAHRYFPIGTIHIVIVDPGVGTDRKAIIVKTPQALFVAPDNGVLSDVIEDRLTAVNITDSHFWIEPVSATFHGRDIFAPVAAHLSLGTPINEFGEVVSNLRTSSLPQSQIGADGSINGEVIHIDHFGNLITNIKQSDIPESRIRILVKGHSIDKLSHSFAETEGLLALIGSDGHLEIGMKNGNATDLLCAEVGEKVNISRLCPSQS